VQNNVSFHLLLADDGRILCVDLKSGPDYTLTAPARNELFRRRAGARTAAVAVEQLSGVMLARKQSG